MGVLLVVLLFAAAQAGQYIQKRLAIHEDLIKTESFRTMRLSEELLAECAELEKASGISAGKLLALAFAENNASFPAHMPEFSVLEKEAAWVERWCPAEFERLENAFAAVWEDVKCFPVRCNAGYEDSWMSLRTYGGERGHEGTDLMPPENVSGFYPVFSMTDGVVEQLGWLEKGGYRVGIRSPHGGYFYYAHLSEYSQGLTVGDEVEAGHLLGYMGDTGYGSEGTVGQFAVHLHLGIYIQTPDGQELSVNPYWVLRKAEIL